MQLEFENLGLWKRTLGKQQNFDKYEMQRDRLRLSFLNMRKNAADLVSLIPKDCEGLTVHDISHLDALWEMADIIVGDDYPLNPIEVFVLGAAILVHDSGMSVAAYPGGMEELSRTTVWQDNTQSVLRRIGFEVGRKALQSELLDEHKKEIIFSVLRSLHAKHAEELPTLSWRHPGNGESLRLLEDQHLRDALGKAIGRIAHSHHWDIEKVSSNLRDKIGAPSDFPKEWTLDEVKVACILRCADAAHIDHRRAPSLLYAFTNLKGVSKNHWNFQNKLNKPTKRKDALVYSSGQDFLINDASSWWLCFDAIKLINSEVMSSNSLLQDSGRASFEIKRVMGADSPRLLSKEIVPTGWHPVNAEIMVSDPISLARTLGGKNLYGDGAFAPIRELLQNAADAVRARRKFEQREDHWGSIKLFINVDKKTNSTWLHVDDNGIGMPERVLVGALLDFGKSFWNSSQMREEYPGLEAKGIEPVGKFGIGFFSIFLLGSKVKVTSKRFDNGAKDARTLEFDSIATRPLIRNARESELPIDYNTRVSVLIDNPKQLSMTSDHSDYRTRHFGIGDYTLANRLKQLVCAMDIKIEFHSDLSKEDFIHEANWVETSQRDFLEELLATAEATTRSVLIKAYSPILEAMYNADGQVIGRAALNFMRKGNLHSSRDASNELVSVGGFAYRSGRGSNVVKMAPYLGVIKGDTSDITRSMASIELHEETIKNWASSQSKKIAQDKYLISDCIVAARSILSVGGNPGKLPICFLGGKFTSLSEFEQTTLQKDSILFPMGRRDYNDNFDIKGINELGTDQFTLNLKPEVAYFSIQGDNGIFTKEFAEQLFQNKTLEIQTDSFDNQKIPHGLDIAMDIAKRIWSSDVKLFAHQAQIYSDDLFSPLSKQWVIRLSRIGN